MSYVTSEQQDVTDLTGELLRLYSEHPALVVVGSIGRAAMYETLDWPEAPPLTLWYRKPIPPYELARRSIDGVVASGTVDWSAVATLGPYPVSRALHGLLFERPDNTIGWYYEEESIAFDPQVFAPRTRSLAGAPVRTFGLGTAYCVEQLRKGPAEPPEAARRQEEFARFVSHMHATHPDEFLPAELYEPFIRFNNRIELPPGSN